MTTDSRSVTHVAKGARAGMGRRRALLAMTRPSQLALIMLVLLNGLLLGWQRSGTPNGSLVAAATLLVLAAAAAVHLVNEAEDHVTDRLTERTAFSGGSGALAAAGLPPAVPRRLGLLLALVVTMSAIVLAAAADLPTSAALLLLTGLGGGLLYSLPPVSAMRHGWGEPLNAILGGLLLPLFGVAAVRGTVTTLDVIAFLPFCLVVLASVMATAWPDRQADQVTGKRTLQVRLQPRSLRRLHAFTTVAFVAATLVAALAGAMPQPLLGLAVVPPLLLALRWYTRRRSPLPNVTAMIGLALLTTVVLGTAVRHEAGA